MIFVKRISHNILTYLTTVFSSFFSFFLSGAYVSWCWEWTPGGSVRYCSGNCRQWVNFLLSQAIILIRGLHFPGWEQMIFYSTRSLNLRASQTWAIVKKRSTLFLLHNIEMLYWHVQLAHYNFHHLYPPGSPRGQSSATHMVLGARRLVITPWMDHIHMPSIHIGRALGGTGAA